jgi:cytochrome c-type biogenesis protein CcmH
MTDRYGEFVLYKPPFAGKTSLLWIAPVLFLLMGLITVFFVIRRKRATAQLNVDTLDITPEKQKKIRSLLEKGELS